MKYSGMISLKKVIFWILLPLASVLVSPGLPAHSASPEVRLSVMPLDPGRPPTVREIAVAGQLGGELHPTHGFRDANDEARVNSSFGEAIQAWNMHEYDRAVKRFQEHLAAYPDSPWAAEAELHVGCYAYYHGRYSDAEDAFNRIIENNRLGSFPGQKSLVSKAKLRLGVLRVAQDRFEEALEIFTDLRMQGHDWRHRTYAAHWIQRLSRYKIDKLALLDCGTKALGYVLEKRGKEAAAKDVANIHPQSLHGFSLEILSELAARNGLDLVAVKLPVGEVTKLTLPAIVYVGTDGGGARGHYWVLEKHGKGGCELLDPQSRQRFIQTPEEFAREWSGVALVCADSSPVPGVRLSKAETGRTFGSCCGLPRPPDELGDTGRNGGPGGDSQCSQGAPAWSVNMVNMNLYVADTPLWYSSPIGPPVEITLSHNSESSVTYSEPFGNKWQFNYGSYLVVDPGQTVTVFMPDGRIDIFTPDGSGGFVQPYHVFNRLRKIADNHFELRFPDDTVYVYNIPSGTSSLQPFLVQIKDVHGQGLAFRYNASVQLTTITDSVGRATTLTYNALGLVTQAEDPFGRTASFLYDANKNLVKITDMGGYWSKLTYDADVYLTGMENSRGKWRFRIEAADGIANGSDPYPSPGSAMWENYRITATNPLGDKQEYYFNGYSSYSWYVSPRDYVAYVGADTNNFKSALQTVYRFSSRGQDAEISSVTYPGGGSVSFGYDANGNRTTITDAHKDITTLVYNTMGRATSVTDPRGSVLQFVYAANGFDVLKESSGLGSIVRTYNSTHDLTSVRDRMGNTPWKFTYDSYGHPLSATDPLGKVTTYAYDGKHQLNQIKRAGLITDTLVHDSVGRVSKYTDAAGFVKTYAYNKIDNITKVSYSDSKYVALTYSGCCPRLIEQVADRAGRITHYEYDALKRLTRVIDPAGNAISHQYDKNGNLTGLVDANGNSTNFDYDLNGHLLKKTYADGKSTDFSYDEAGLPISRTNARGIVTTYGYDESHNLMTVSYSDDTPGVTLAYDNYSRLVQRHDAAGAYLYGYDKNSRMTSIDGPWTNDTVSYKYDPLGRRSGLAVQGGQSLTYNYDALGRLAGIKNGTESYKYTYSGVNPMVQSLTRPNGSKTVYQYDTLKRLNLISHRDSANAVIQEYAYTYNGQDQRSGENKTDGSPVLSLQKGFTQFDYNTVNQLTASTSQPGAFLYDDDGNMAQGYTPEGYQFHAAYDAENRLESIQYTGSGGKIFKLLYTYSAGSAIARMRSYTNGVLTGDTRYVREGFRPLQERDAAGNVQRQYAWGLGMGGGIGGLLQLSQGAQEYSYLYDGRGNVSGLLDGSQAVAAAYTYDGYGNILARSGALDQPYRFSTKAYDEGTGLVNYGFRFYSPAMGRWITRDPIDEKGGIHLYGFVGNNPIDRVDPEGLAQIDPQTGFQVTIPLNSPTFPFTYYDSARGYVTDWLSKEDILAKIQWGFLRAQARQVAAQAEAELGDTCSKIEDTIVRNAPALKVAASGGLSVVSSVLDAAVGAIGSILAPFVYGPRLNQVLDNTPGGPVM